jgi:hypothetical protein
LENIQALCLIVGAFVLWLQARAATDDSTKHALALASLGYITMFLLEFDVRPFKIPALTWLLNGPVRNLWLGGLWLYFLGRAARTWRRVLEKGISWLQSTAGAVMTLSALCWIAGAAVDRLKPYSSLHNFFAEEFTETQAALLMLWGAAELVHLAALERFAPSAPAAPVGSL